MSNQIVEMYVAVIVLNLTLQFLSELVYQVRLVQLRCGRQLYCVWISRDAEEEDPQYGNLTFTSSLDSSAIEPSFGQEIQTRAQNSSRPGSVSMMTQCEDELVTGAYGERYTTLQQIGKGAYGFVKMAYRNEDNALVSKMPQIFQKSLPIFLFI